MTGRAGGNSGEGVRDRAANQELREIQEVQEDKMSEPRNQNDLGYVTTTRCAHSEGSYWIASVRVGPPGEFGSIAVVPGEFESEEQSRLAAQDLYRSRVALIGEQKGES